MSLSDAYEDLVLDHILGTTELVFDATVFLALGADATPSKTTFTEVMTPTTGGYSRQAIVFNASGADGIAENSAGTLTFGPCSGTAWSTVKSFAIWKDQTATATANRITQGPLTDQTKVVGLGDSVTVAAGAITVTAT
jgi:hypothetical protein